MWHEAGRALWALQLTWQEAGAVLLNPQWTRKVARGALLGLQQEQTAAWEPRSAGGALLGLHQEQRQGQQVWRPPAEGTLTVAAWGTRPAQDATAGAVQCKQSVRDLLLRCSPLLAE